MVDFNYKTELAQWVECSVDDDRTVVHIINYTAQEATQIMKTFLDSLESDEREQNGK